jgi:hypothetical protein
VRSWDRSPGGIRGNLSARRLAPEPSAEPQEPATLVARRNFRRCSRAVHRMVCSQRECLPRPRPLRRSLPLWADLLLGLVLTALSSLMGGDQLARLGTRGSTVPSGAH